MANITVNISVPEELLHYLKAQIALGYATNVSDAVRQCVRDHHSVHHNRKRFDAQAGEQFQSAMMRVMVQDMQRESVRRYVNGPEGLELVRTMMGDEQCPHCDQLISNCDVDCPSKDITPL